MKLVYVAGPFSGPTRNVVEANIRRAVEVGLEVAKAGFMPVVPHANTADPEYEKVQPYEFWIEGTTALLLLCDAMVVVPDATVVLISIRRFQQSGRGMHELLASADRCGVVETWCEPTYDTRVALMGRYSRSADSSGVKREREQAARRGIPVFETLEALRAWGDANN